MEITSDWHIHSRNSCDEACMTVEEIIIRAEEKGIRNFGLTDHIHTPYNLPDLVESRNEWKRSDPGSNFHFGVEASCVSQWEIDEIALGKYDAPKYGVRNGGPIDGPLAIGLTAEDIEKYSIEYVVGGVHWPMYVPFERKAVIRDYHRQNMFLANHPLIDIIAHPWWWMGHWKNSDGSFTTGPWFDSFNCIPKSMHNELAAAAREHGKVIEINLSAVLLNKHYPEYFKNQYLHYLTYIKSEGVKLSIGSDCHGAHYRIDFNKAGAMLDRYGISDEELWRLEPGHITRPVKSAARRRRSAPEEPG